MPISLILTPFYHFHFRPALAVKCIPDLRVCLNQVLLVYTKWLRRRMKKVAMVGERVAEVVVEEKIKEFTELEVLFKDCGG